MKVLIEVTTPGNGKSYEIMLDDKLTVGVARDKIIEQIQSFENGCIAFEEGAALFALASRTQLPDHRNLRKAGIKGGQQLFLL